MTRGLTPIAVGQISHIGFSGSSPGTDQVIFPLKSLYYLQSLSMELCKRAEAWNPDYAHIALSISSDQLDAVMSSKQPVKKGHRIR